MELKDVLGEIEADGADLVHGRLLEWSSTPSLWQVVAVGSVHTISPPGNPKPLRSHSMASKPWIVRRAVWKAWMQPTRGMGLFTRKWSLSIPCCRCLVT